MSGFTRRMFLGSAGRYNIPTEFAIWGSSSAQGYGGGGVSVGSELQARFGIPMYNGGVGGQWSTHVAARQGGRPALLSLSGGSIPASGTIAATTPTMHILSFSAAGSLQGVSGTLASSGDLTTYQFTRSASGSVTSVPNDTPFIPTQGSQRRADGTIIWSGKNDITSGTGNMAICAESVDATVAYLLPRTQYLVMGHFANSTMPVGTSARTRMDAENARLASIYGDRYVDVYAYLKSAQVWVDSGVTPNATDLSDQADGVIPISLRSDTGHLNGAGYAAVAVLVGDTIVAQGWLG
ncbi:hypothetical protein IPL85_02635 [Candidatus Saccharibacteria bacterium]|nr:MAG: hypothetical protein IPL85_02635 [Candidatus Saccharibacteria bacterium]